MKRLKYAPILLALVAFSLVLAACGTGSTAAKNGAAKVRTSTTSITEQADNAAAVQCPKQQELGPDSLYNARQFAQEQGLPAKKVIRWERIDACFLEDVSDLEAQLRKHEADTFAGLWIQHKPEYRYVVLFTRDGQETIRPYTEGEPYVRFIEVRSWADATLKELHVAQDKAGHLLDRLDVRTEGTGIDVQTNRAVIYVTNKARFEAAPREAGARLPEQVGVVKVEGHISPS